MCLETISEEKIVFLFFFHKSIRILSEIVCTFEKNILVVGTVSSTGPEDFWREKIFIKIFFQKIFRTLREKFPDLLRTFDRQGLEISIFSARGTLWRGTIFSKWMR